jgi:hypothetical protein
MSGCLPIIKQQLELEATNESLLNLELNLAVGVIVCSDEIKPLLLVLNLLNKSGCTRCDNLGDSSQIFNGEWTQTSRFLGY